MTIQKDGHTMGKTPLSFNMPGSNYPFVLRADWVERRYNAKMQSKEFPRVLFRIVYPNDTQVVDLLGATAK